MDYNIDAQWTAAARYNKVKEVTNSITISQTDIDNV